MSRHSLGFTPTGPGTSLLPQSSIYASANARIILREIHVIQTTTTAVELAVQRLSTAGTSAAQTGEGKWDVDTPNREATIRDTHTSTGPTITAGEIEAILLPGIIGSAWLWAFDGSGFIIPIGVANGAGVVVVNGAGQVVETTYVWEE